MWGGGMFLYYSYVCMVKTMRFEGVGNGREPRADEDQLTHIHVKTTAFRAVHVAGCEQSEVHFPRTEYCPLVHTWLWVLKVLAAQQYELRIHQLQMNWQQTPRGLQHCDA